MDDLIVAALRAWRSGRAFIQDGRYMLRPLGEVCGVTTIVPGRSSKAPWSNAAILWFGADSTRLHRTAMLAFPACNETPFARMHGIDSVAGQILRGEI